MPENTATKRIEASASADHGTQQTQISHNGKHQASGEHVAWSNWSGNQQLRHGGIAKPTTIAALCEIVRGAPGPIRIVGSGHSWTPLVPTAGTMVTLEHIESEPVCDRENLSARVMAGWKLRELSEHFEREGMAFPNLGDIDHQTFAGAAATATHGTGSKHPCLSAFITGVSLMMADGTIVEANRETNLSLLQAAQVSLGVLGVIVEVDLALRARFTLHRKTWAEPIDSIVSQAEERWQNNRNYEFFYVPFSGVGINVTRDETDAAAKPLPFDADEFGLTLLKWGRDLLSWNAGLRRTITAAGIRLFPTENAIGASWQILSKVRKTRFQEMEYHLPCDVALDVFHEVIAMIEAEQPEVYIPVEVRRTAGDDAWLSPFNGAPRTSIAVHAYESDDYGWLYSKLEPVFLRAGGRPHWGKLHSLKAGQLSELYPNFERFRALRKELDPNGRFLNAHSAEIFGEASTKLS